MDKLIPTSEEQALEDLDPSGVGSLPRIKIESPPSLSRLPPLSEFKIRWAPVIYFGLIHLGAIAALFFFSWPAFITAAALYFFTGCVGITVGYHRMIAHNAFETGPLVKAFHLLMASLALQLGPITWTRLHRIHHAKAQTEEDPHTQHLGFFWGYIGWIFLGHPRVGQSRLWGLVKARELYRDPIILFFEKYTSFIFLGSLVVFYLIGGLSMMLWAGCLRAIVVSHVIWGLNRMGHTFGKQSFTRDDDSRNSMLVALPTFGEGWHNNHHAFPASARFGLYWWQIDCGWYWINFLRMLGLAWNVKTPAVYAPNPKGEYHPF